ncbi:MAG: hypothetical protein M0P91_03565 [Sulfuricurvum sp.]|jgi:MFS family permease|uniref:hypothetical protein n=1 Tax=Sulfuricurvum sp. TaxID=2025608 RepID=UPI0025D6F00D|nr:hypothetical protein [Sulfuricurvum sp.]MCK9372248.1 hypothetical protein [Sulfuricurvum sp.]
MSNSIINNTFEGPNPETLKMVKEWRALYEAITQGKGRPLNHWEITALLEIYGLRDIDAREQYGLESLFALAKMLTEFIEDYKYEVKTYELEAPPSKVKRITLNYFAGMAFALPMLIQVFFTLVIGYGLWSSLDLDVRTATAIAVGTFAALVVTGGPAQAIGRKGLFYIKMEEYNLAHKISGKLFRIFIVQIIIVGILIYLMNFVFDLIPKDMMLYLIVYYFLLAFLFTTLAIFYMMELYGTIALYILVGVVLVYFFHILFFHLGIILSQVLSLLITDVIVFVDAFRRIRKLKEKSREKEGDAEPRLSLLFYSLNPYMIYGTLYFLFLIMDRILAWSATPFQPYFIWFNVRDEIGLDWALIVLILLIGMSEVIIYEFMYRVNVDITKHRYDETRIFNKIYQRFFLKYNIIFFVISFFVIIFVYFAIFLLAKYTDWDFLDVFMVAPTPFIYLFAAISYAFLSNALTNILFFFSYSRYKAVVKGIAVAVVVNIIVGLILSRLLGYEYAVFGLLTGSILFWGFVIHFGNRFFKNLDYYYYSAY